MRGFIFIDKYSEDNTQAYVRVLYRDEGKTKYLCKGTFDFINNIFTINETTWFLCEPEGIEILVETLIDNDWAENIRIICDCDEKYLSLSINECKNRLNKN